MRPGEDELRRLYEAEGLTLKAIGGRFGVTEQAVHHWMVRANIPRRKNAHEKYPGAEVVRRLYIDERKSLRQISEECGASIPVVSRWLKRAGVESRSISEGTSLAQKGRPLSEAHKDSLRKNAVVARSRITAESRTRQREKMVGRTPPNKGVPWTAEQRAKHMALRSTDEWREKQAAALRGEKSLLWRGGKTPDSSLHGWRWRKRRREVYERDNWTCADCKQRCLNTKDSRSKPKLKIQAHHIVSRRNGGGDELDNLVTLCMSCHHKRERSETG